MSGGGLGYSPQQKQGGNYQVYSVHGFGPLGVMGLDDPDGGACDGRVARGMHEIAGCRIQVSGFSGQVSVFRFQVSVFRFQWSRSPDLILNTET